MLRTLSATTVAVAGYLAMLLLANFAVLRDLAALASKDPTVSHIILVPLVTAALLYEDREKVFSRRQMALGSGLGIVLFGVALLVVGRFAAGDMSPRDALAIALSGVVVASIGGFVLFFGRAAARFALFPLAFLCFAIPIPTFVLDAITGFLKSGSTATTAALFTVAGTPFHRAGFEISLPGFVIEIADECSGIRSSIALLLTAALTAHRWLTTATAKWLLILAILPVAVLKNGLRIATLSWLAIYVDPGFLVGQLHNEGGFVFFLLALVIMAPLLSLLRMFERSIVASPGAL